MLYPSRNILMKVYHIVETDSIFGKNAELKIKLSFFVSIIIISITKKRMEKKENMYDDKQH